MKLTLYQLCTLALMLLASQQVLAAPPKGKKPARLVESKRLRNDLKLNEAKRTAQRLQDFADASPDKNRVFGSEGHRATVNYIASEFRKLGDYYDVTVQPFTATYAEHAATVAIDDTPVPSPATFTYSPNADVTDTPIVRVNNLGCDQTDFPAEVEGKVALIQRGSCEFGIKVARAGTAKAAAVLIYNNAPGELSGTLSQVGPRPEGPYVGVAGLTQEEGNTIATRLAAGETVLADMKLTGVIEDRTTHNVIIETKGGNKDQVIFLGAHSDSVAAGPGLNDNGSGSTALIEVAKKLSKYSVTNAVRFAWWSAEEFGLLGAEHYVENLSQAQKDQIRLYLNFDMISSPNYRLAVYDGDGSRYNLTGPAGSAEAEKLFADYFRDEARLPLVESEFDGRSDYGPFLDAGIASGGLDTGAEKLKTEEEARLFGGQAGVAYDVNYHQAGDRITNINWTAFEVNAKAIAHAVATYARSFESLGPRRRRREVKEEAVRRQVGERSKHSNHRCGGDLAAL